MYSGYRAAPLYVNDRFLSSTPSDVYSTNLVFDKNPLWCYLQGVKFFNNNQDQQGPCNENMQVHEVVIKDFSQE